MYALLRRLKTLWNQIPSDWRPPLPLLAVFSVGLLCLFIPLEFFHQFGHALIIAAVLGWLVDRSLKYKLVRDAFEAAYGYVLREEFKQEIHRVMNYKTLCKESRLVVKIEPLATEGYVQVTASFERVIENTTQNIEPFMPYIDVDEWSVPNFSSSLQQYTVNGIEYYPDRLNQRKSVSPPKLIFQGEDVSMPASGEVHVVGKYCEARPSNGEFSVAWTTPTLNPTVTILLPKGFAGSCSFGVPGETLNSSAIDHTYALRGSQFPGQETSIRWWPVNE
jgi:hypothetical protein